MNQDGSVRAAILTGAGSAFSSGGDLRAMAAETDNRARQPVKTPSYYKHGIQRLPLAFERLDVPIIAAVNGPAIGGGFCLALVCDLRLAAPAAYFRAAGIVNGLTASELGISYLLPRAVGSARAAEIMLTGRDVTADEGQRIGLVATVSENLLDDAYAVADRVLGFSRPGVELTKRMLWASLDAASMQAHMDHEGVAQLFVRLTTRNFEEAVAARKEKRAPEFKD
jgi:enoyl-CoA hydratase